MLKVTWFEFLIRGIPEGLLFVMANYAFAKKKISPFPFILSSIILILITYGVRFLDINFGVHTILNLLCLILTSVLLLKIDLYTAVKGAMISTLMMFGIEAVSVLILQAVFGDNLTAIIEDPYKKTLAGLPAFIVFAAIVIVAYFYMTRKGMDRSKDGAVGKQSSK